MTDLVVLAVVIVVVLVALVPISRHQADRSLARMHRHRREVGPGRYVPVEMLWSDWPRYRVTLGEEDDDGT